MCKVMKYSLYKADAEEENEDSPKLDEKPGGGSTCLLYTSDAADE